MWTIPLSCKQDTHAFPSVPAVICAHWGIENRERSGQWFTDVLRSFPITAVADKHRTSTSASLGLNTAKKCQLQKTQRGLWSQLLQSPVGGNGWTLTHVLEICILCFNALAFFKERLFNRSWNHIRSEFSFKVWHVRQKFRMLRHLAKTTKWKQWAVTPNTTWPCMVSLESNQQKCAGWLSSLAV